MIAHEMQVMISKAKTDVKKICKDSIITFFIEGEQRKAASKEYAVESL